MFEQNIMDMSIVQLQETSQDIVEEIHNRKVGIAKSFGYLVELIQIEYTTKNKIQAIKVCRELTGQGLKVGKVLVEELASQGNWVEGTLKSTFLNT